MHRKYSTIFNLPLHHNCMCIAIELLPHPLDVKSFNREKSQVQERIKYIFKEEINCSKFLFTKKSVLFFPWSLKRNFGNLAQISDGRL